MYWMTIPVFVMGVIFNYLPAWGWYLAFIDFQPGIPVWDSVFVGLKYFARLFETGSSFLVAFRNTVVLSLLGLLVLPAAVFFAVCVSEVKNKAFKTLVQTASSLPYFVSWIIVYAIFFFFLSVDNGYVNQVLLALGWIAEPIDFLGNVDYSWAILTASTIWKTLGYTAIVFIAAIAGLDQELYEAAEIDGASRSQKIMKITIPQIMPTFAVMTILTVGQMLNIGFEQYWSFRNPLTVDAVEVLDTYAYATGIAGFEFSYATAIGVFKTVASCVLLVFANGVFKKIMNRSIF